MHPHLPLYTHCLLILYACPNFTSIFYHSRAHPSILGIRISSELGRGGYVRDIVFENITFSWATIQRKTFLLHVNQVRRVFATSLAVFVNFRLPITDVLWQWKGPSLSLIVEMHLFFSPSNSFLQFLHYTHGYGNNFRYIMLGCLIVKHWQVARWLQTQCMNCTRNVLFSATLPPSGLHTRQPKQNAQLFLKYHVCKPFDHGSATSIPCGRHHVPVPNTVWRIGECLCMRMGTLQNRTFETPLSVSIGVL